MWSYKLNKPGRRYQLLCDGFGTPLKIFGGYSPKCYDAHWVSINKNWLNNELNHCIIMGDCHYWSAQAELSKSKLIASMPQTIKPKNGLVTVGLKTLNVDSDEFKYNQHTIKQVRSNVERPFGQMKQMFNSLPTKFRDGIDQLDCLVKFADAVLLHKEKFYYLN